ncbi:MAG: type I toxin-antitoxin system SymE family toxin, partial [Gammaproteobacteria bacterium]|nr:type I toxin-antitoxin system SymE family toxin [Gammaproteobacteria bacterium]
MAKRTIPPEHRSAQEKSTTFRQLKVRKGYYPHQFNARQPYFVPKPVPWIQLKGYWLNQAGFTIGTPITVQIQRGRLILKVKPSI